MIVMGYITFFPINEFFVSLLCFDYWQNVLSRLK